MAYTLAQIAHIETDFSEKFGIPRQSGLVEELRARIVFEPEFRSPDAVRGLDGYDYIWLVWQFSTVVQAGQDGTNWRPTVRPPRLGGNTRMGVFATRSPFRPNALGLSSVKLLKVEPNTPQGPVLTVGGADLLDGTPIFDIKPYLPYVDAHPDARGGFTDTTKFYTLQVQAEPEVLEQIPADKRDALLGVLRSDPRPSYQHDPERLYGLSFGGVEVKFKGYGKITEENISEMMREIRLSLLEADVNYKVVKEFTNNVKEKAIGEEVNKSLNPGELFVKIVKDELTELLGGENTPLNISGNPATLMLVGLQGSGKTTTIGKLANYLRKNNKKKPLLVACDVYRPAAIDQLKQIGKELNIEVYSEGKGNPVEISKNAIKYAKDNGYDYVLIDTAGRLQIDESLMDELDNIQKEVNPDETILVIDSMMGQDAINVINGFNDKIKLSGVILTKLDGDTRGGVALSVKHLTNLPIKFIGVSEKMDGLTPFYPERMASRILGMGDILSIVEQVQSEIDEKEAEKTAKKMMKGNFDLEDFLNQLNQIKKLGPLENLLKLLPGAKKMGLNNVNIDPKIMKRTEAIVLSMTLEERRDPSILKASRKKRIADGSGTTVTDVNKLLNQFEEMKKMMKMMGNGNFKMPF